MQSKWRVWKAQWPASSENIDSSKKITAQIVLNLTVGKGHLSSLLGNTRVVVQYLAQHHPKILSELQKIAEMTSLESNKAA